MERIKNFIKKPPVLMAAAACIMVVILILSAAVMKGAAKEGESREPETVVYEYTPEEQELADAMEDYLAEYITVGETESMKVADTAVQSYRTILSSGIRNVSEEHTKALSQRMRYALEEAVGKDTDRITDEGLDALADGACGIIWDFILAQIEEKELPEEEEEFVKMAESLQKQIDELMEKDLSVKISTNIKDKGVSREELENSEQNLLAQIWDGIQGTKDSILKEMETRLGDGMQGTKDSILKDVETRLGNVRDGKDGVNGKDGENGKNGSDGRNGKDGNDGKDGAAGTNGEDGKDGADGKDGEDGKDGADGKDGEDGKDGADGKDGENGKDGADGESVYIMYSEYPSGRDAGGSVSMSPVQSNTTKYMGTAYTSQKTAPGEPESYTWSEYKDYIIFSATDESGVPTVYIQ